MAIILITCGTVVLLGYAAYIGQEYYSFKRDTADQLSTISKMIAANSTAALAFRNAADAEEILSSLRVEPHVLQGILFDDKGEILARYSANDSLSRAPESLPEWMGTRFTDGRAAHIEPVVLDNRPLGMLYLQLDMSVIYERFILYLGIAGCILAVSFILAFLFSTRMQKNLTTPILDLAGTARIISEQRNFSLRAKKYYEDEIGVLTEAFNKMLVRIEHQNQEIVSFNQDLEKKVAARTKELEMAYQEMEAFSYMVSHDLNAPLRHIDNYVSLYLERQDGKLDEAGKKTLDAISRNARKMRQLIEDLLTFSQLGRKEMTRSKVSMMAMVKEIIAEHEKIASQRSINFKVHKLPIAYADSVTIRQVWDNLISNAIKYSGRTTNSQIEIKSWEKPHEIIYCVADNGVGFDMKDYDKLFNPFQRLHNQSQFEGTGVGLAIVDRIISKHGGKVWAESKHNEGARFYFSLPRT